MNEVRVISSERAAALGAVLAGLIALFAILRMGH